MSLIGRFVKREVKEDREPCLRDPDQILAYLEELFRLRTKALLRMEEDSDTTYTTQVEAVNEEMGTFTISLQNRPPQEPKPGALFDFHFCMDGLRFQTQARFLARGGYLQSVLALPEAIRHSERRTRVRVRFSHREPAKAVALEGLFQGLGISGRIQTLSIGGLGLRVDKVIDIGRDTRLKVGGDLFPEGMPLGLIRLQDLPQTPMLECSGVVRYVETKADSILLGIAFEAIGTFETQALARVIARKSPGFGLGFPRKRRRGEIESEDGEALPLEGEEEAMPPSDAELSLDDREIEDLRVIVRSPNSVAQLRRRSRHFLLIGSDELDRAILLGTLFVDGYRNLHEASGLIQALDQARRHPLDAIVVDHQVGNHSALEVIQQLRTAGRLANAKVIVLRDREDIKLKVAEKAGGIDLLVPRPIDFDGFLKPQLEQLLSIC